MTSNLPKVCIYRSEILPPSETFIQAQVGAMRRYDPVYVGCRKVPGIQLPEDKTRFVNRGGAAGRISEVVFKLTAGMIPDSGLAALRPVLVHAHFGPDAAEILGLVKRLKLPLIFTAHGFDFTQHDHVHRQTRRGTRFVRRRARLGKEASRVIAVSRYMANAAISQGIPARKVTVHYIGVDTKSFAPGSRRVAAPTVLFVGRLVEKKGCEYAIRAVAEIQEAVPGVELVVIGDGPLRSSLEILASRCLRRYSFMGAQSNTVVRDTMRRAAVFCTPSIVAESGDAEGLGIVFLEAQAAGVPVASFASGGIPEAVVHGVTGLLAPERDSRALATNLATLLTNQGLWQQFSDAAIRHVRANFDLTRQTALLEDIYDEVIREQRSGKPPG